MGSKFIYWFRNSKEVFFFFNYLVGQYKGASSKLQNFIDPVPITLIRS